MFTKIFDGHLVKQYAIVIGVNLSLLGTGMSLLWPSPMIVKLRDIDQTPLDRPITEEEGSWIVSIGYIVGIVTNLLPAVLMDRIGRKYSVFMGVIPKIVGGFFLLFATDVWMLLLGRALNGTGDSILFCTVPTYASEVASKEIRGGLSTILQVMCSLGAVTMLSIGPFVSYVTMSIIFLVIMIVTAVPLIFVPDSPYFLYTKGDNDATLKVLAFLRGSETAAYEELKEYDANSTDGQNQKRTIEIIKDNMFLKSFLLAGPLMVGVQLSGFTTVSFYLQTILESTQTSVRPEIASVILGCIQLIASIFTMSFTDKCGRKPIMTVTLIGMIVGMVGLGTFFFVTEDADYISGVMNFLPLISLILFVFSYSAGPGSLVWSMSAELFNNSSRALGMTLGVMLSNVAISVSSRFFAPVMLAIGPAATYWMFSGIAAFLCAFIFFLIPETKGKSVAEIQRELGAKQVLDDEKVGF